MKKICLSLYIIILLFINVSAQPQPVMNAAEMQLALKKLNILGSVLYIAAHPDDENTAILSYFASDRLYRTGYLSLTRGDGGQNLIGSEQSSLLGLIRTQELLDARRIDKAEQFFTRAIDFGFTKNPEETFTLWDKQKLLSDVVWVIRKFKPDVILTRFPITGEGGHGQHTASAILAEEAFKLAGDKNAFPEQLKYLEVWQPKRLYWNAWAPILEQRKQDVSTMPKIDAGKYNPLLGKSYTEIAAESRSMHKSQGFGSSSKRGESINYFEYRFGSQVKNDLFEDVDLSWQRVKGSGKAAKLLKEAEEKFNPDEPYKILPLLLQAYSELKKLDENYWVPLKLKELKNLIRSATGIWIEATAANYSAVPGDSASVSAGVINRSPYHISLQKISFSTGDSFNKADSLSSNIFSQTDVKIKIPANAPYSNPYWLEKTNDGKLFTVEEQQLIGMPENPPAVEANFTLRFDTTTIDFSEPLVYRWTDPVQGEEYRPFIIVPPVTMNFKNKLYLFPDEESRTVQVIVKENNSGIKGRLSLEVPGGWNISPAGYDVNLASKGEEKIFEFTVTPPAGESTAEIQVVFESGGKKYNKGLIEINYPHIPVQDLFPDASAKLLRLKIEKKINNIGYVMGAGDEVAPYLQQLEYNITFLTDDDIEKNNLSKYDAIILGVRALNTRGRLSTLYGNLLEYVNKGGTLVMQYNVNTGLIMNNIAPYSLQLSRDRVTVEDAPVKFIDEKESLLNYPNKITQDDFNGWVQERGLYFASQWGAEFQPVLSMSDPGESPSQGSLLYAKYGKGMFIYTGLSFFRQLPAGVPGAYRLFVNLISAMH